MKKQIDPNLNNSADSDLILGDGMNQKAATSGAAIPDVGEAIEDILLSDTPSTADGKTDGFEITAKDQAELMKEYHSHHHHHHHHHSSSSSGSHHSHHSHHSDKKKKSTTKKVLLIVLGLILLMIAVTATTFMILRSQGEKSIKQPVLDSAYGEVVEYNGHKYAYNKDIVTLAFLGVDQEAMMSTDNSTYVGCSDADILIAINSRTGKTGIVAVPRDTMVDVDQYNKKGEFVKTGNVQLCLAYAYGDGKEKSCNNVINAMSRIMYDIPVEKYYALDLAGVGPLNDAIGGVTLESMYDLPDYGIQKGKTVILKGDAAKAYVRTRDMDRLDASMSRTERQMQYVKAYVAQVIPAVMKRFGTVTDLYNTAAAYSQTNISLSDATYLASLLLSKGVTSFDTYSISGELKAVETTDYPDAVHVEFYPDEDSLMSTVLEVFYERID